MIRVDQLSIIFLVESVALVVGNEQLFSAFTIFHAKNCVDGTIDKTCQRNVELFTAQHLCIGAQWIICWKHFKQYIPYLFHANIFRQMRETHFEGKLGKAVARWNSGQRRTTHEWTKRSLSCQHQTIDEVFAG